MQVCRYVGLMSFRPNRNGGVELIAVVDLIAVVVIGSFEYVHSVCTIRRRGSCVAVPLSCVLDAK